MVLGSSLPMPRRGGLGPCFEISKHCCFISDASQVGDCGQVLLINFSSETPPVFLRLGYHDAVVDSLSSSSSGLWTILL